MWFFIGGLIISVFLLIFFIIDIVYGYRVYNNFTISSGEATFLIIINSLGLLIVFSMIFMFFFQIFSRSKMNVSNNIVNEVLGVEKMHKHMKPVMSACHPCNNGLCGTGCASQTKQCYSPPTCYE